MVEYKVLSAFTNDLEPQLNALARQGWRVVSSFHEAGKVRPTIILVREIPVGGTRD